MEVKTKKVFRGVSTTVGDFWTSKSRSGPVRVVGGIDHVDAPRCKGVETPDRGQRHKESLFS